MENVSKALLIAATTLLALLLIGMFVYIFRAGSRVNESYDTKQLVEQLELYNSKFELYAREQNTIMDLITVANLAYSINEEVDYDSTNNVVITIDAGNQGFEIPGKDEQLARNQIMLSHTTSAISEKIISIFKLATLTLDELGVENGNTDKLSETRYTAGTDNKTEYKYLFRCKNILYEHSSGKVSSMEFDMYENPNW